MLESQEQAKLHNRLRHLVAMVLGGLAIRPVSQSVCKIKKKQTYSLLGGNEKYIPDLKCIKDTVCICKEWCPRMKRFQTLSKFQTFPLVTSHTAATSGQCVGSRELGLRVFWFVFFFLQPHSKMKHSTKGRAGPSDSLKQYYK